ncbi:hypothetical protein [Nitrosomonas sp. Is37]|uniref:hypothetical protein n=1 Tax=Nitrosomonas sp. Is37 TaxID=3080535 RepID=UPI00294AE83C|nr:hypothetical protein [Nitrosomonas sp. Is37]MDV6345607.1 hypothetical protein [Nitrosomonas sp. Is37]
MILTPSNTRSQPSKSRLERELKWLRFRPCPLPVRWQLQNREQTTVIGYVRNRLLGSGLDRRRAANAHMAGHEHIGVHLATSLAGMLNPVNSDKSSNPLWQRNRLGDCCCIR